MSIARPIRTALIALASGLAFVAVLTINADYVRDRFFRTDFKFGKKETFDLLDRANQAQPMEIAYEGKRYSVSLALRAQRGVDIERREAARGAAFAAPAFACGHRSFFQTASACLDTTTLAVRGTLKLRELLEPSQPLSIENVSGDLTIVGARMVRARIELRLDDGYAELVSQDARSFEIQMLNMRPTGTRTERFKYMRR